MRRSFTLVEMLVVIGIISVLAALLLPALQRASALAVSLSCLNNLRNIGTGLSQYLDDNKGYLPYYNTFTSTTPSYLKWQDCLMPYVLSKAAGNSAYLDSSTGTPYPPFVCPAQTNTPAMAFLHYGINFYMSVDGLYSNRHLTGVAAPSRRAIIADCQVNSNAFGDYSHLALRHNSNVNVLFGDWHVLSTPSILIPSTTWKVPFWGQAMN